MNDIVVPGVRLCESDDRHIAGAGAYLQELFLYIYSVCFHLKRRFLSYIKLYLQLEQPKKIKKHKTKQKTNKKKPAGLARTEPGGNYLNKLDFKLHLEHNLQSFSK